MNRRQHSIEAAPTLAQNLLEIQTALENVFGRGSVAIVGSSALKLNYAVTGFTDAGHSNGSDVDVVIAKRRMPNHPFLGKRLRNEGFQVTPRINLDGGYGPGPHIGVDLNEALYHKDTKVEIVTFKQIPSRFIVGHSDIEIYRDMDGKEHALRYAGLPLLVQIKLAANLRDSDRHDVINILNRYYQGDPDVFRREEMAAIADMSKHMDPEIFMEQLRLLVKSAGAATGYVPVVARHDSQNERANEALAAASLNIARIRRELHEDQTDSPIRSLRLLLRARKAVRERDRAKELFEATRD